MYMLVADVQGFNAPEFIAKELSFWDGDRLSHYLFKPPFPYTHLNTTLKKQTLWLENNHHGLKWSSGYMCLSELSKILQHETAHAHTVFVKGPEKAVYLQKFWGAKYRLLTNGSSSFNPIPQDVLIIF